MTNEQFQDALDEQAHHLRQEYELARHIGIQDAGNLGPFGIFLLRDAIMDSLPGHVPHTYDSAMKMKPAERAETRARTLAHINCQVVRVTK